MGALVQLTGAAWPGRSPACVCRLHVVAGRPAALVSDESALEACIRDDTLYKLTIFTFCLFNCAKITTDRPGQLA